MSGRSIDGVDVTIASAAHLATFTIALEQMSQFDAPALYRRDDPKARIFVAMFDGTGNDVVNDPGHASNVGKLKKQIESLSEKNPNIAGAYKEGPGTQGGLRGLVDGATGGSYSERLEAMYMRFNEKATKWLAADPSAKISVVSVGFSRGAEQAAGFSRIVHERGVAGIDDVAPQRGAGEGYSPVAEPSIKAGSMPQALALYDPVATGEPARHDRRPAPSVVSGVQIKALDERRSNFPSTSIIAQGVSEDGRFLGVATAGAHSDIGGGYKLNGLSIRNFNIMADYLNKTMGEQAIRKLDVPSAPAMNVVHDSTQHKWFYRGTVNRGVVEALERTGKLGVDAADPKIMDQVRDVARDPRAESFAMDAPDIALKKYPELASAYAAIAAVDRQAQKDGMSEQQRKHIAAYVHQQTVKSIARGDIPNVQNHGRVETIQEGPQGPAH